MRGIAGTIYVTKPSQKRTARYQFSSWEGSFATRYTQLLSFLLNRFRCPTRMYPDVLSLSIHVDHGLRYLKNKRRSTKFHRLNTDGEFQNESTVGPTASNVHGSRNMIAMERA